MTFARNIQEARERRAAEREANLQALCQPARSLHRGTYEGSTEAGAAKPQTYRDPVLLELARDRPCLLLVPGVCSHRVDTTVAAHENEGKGMAIKAPDDRSVWACYACHSWLDQGTAPREYKRAIFADAMQMQVQAWEGIAEDKREPQRFRLAARKALERQGVRA